MAVVLGPNQYGKAEVRMVHVDRSTPVHKVTDLNVSSALRGDFSAAFLSGDNAPILATDTQKNTVYAFAREQGVGQIEDFAARLGRHFVGSYDWITGARVEIEQYPWARIDVGGVPHDHAFSRASAEVRTAVVTIDGDDVHVLAGLGGLVVLKSTGSEFTGFPRDKYTTLAETTDRILATAVTARWRYATPDVDFGATFDGIRSTMLEVFASLHSLALQQTLFEMGKAVIERYPEVVEMRMSMPNKHHFVVDLEPFGLDNPNIVFHADDRPYGKIEAAVMRDDVPEAPIAWLTTPGFC